jgi:GMP synthase-like glutamine amidotransferase
MTEQARAELGPQEQALRRRRVAILHCYPDRPVSLSSPSEPSTAARPHWRNGSEIWASCLGLRERADVELSVLDAVHDALPPARAFDALIVTGSPAGVYERGELPWIAALEAYIRDALADEGGPRVVGGCFGAQLIGSSLGGEVRKAGAFVLGAEELEPTPALARQRFARGLVGEGGEVLAAPDAALVDGYARASSGAGAAGGRSLRVLECHGDAVVALPPGAELLASSRSCAHEVFLAAGGRALAIQGHPEFSVEHELEVITAGRAADGACSAAEAAAARASFAAPRHHGLLLELVTRFLFDAL